MQNRLRRIDIPYSDIETVRPGYNGVFIARLRGGSVTAWAVQKSNLRRWQGAASTRADDVVAAIKARSHR